LDHFVLVTKLAHRTYAAASAIGVVGSQVPVSHVNHLLVCSSRKLTVSAGILACLALPSRVGAITSLGEMEAVFDDVLCPLINCPPATLRGRKQKLVSEGTALRTERTMSRE